MKQLFKSARWQLILYDVVVFAITAVFLLAVYGGYDELAAPGVLFQGVFACLLLLGFRFFGNVYGQIWRYGGIQCYIRMLLTDAAAFVPYVVINYLFVKKFPVTFARMLSLFSVNLLLSLSIRMFYRYAYKCASPDTKRGRFLLWILRVFGRISRAEQEQGGLTPVAIIGAGRVGVALSEAIRNNPDSGYTVTCFVDKDERKTGREIRDIPVISEGEDTFSRLANLGVKELVFAIPNAAPATKKDCYDFYCRSGLPIKVYEKPSVEDPLAKPNLRAFDIEDLLFRDPVQLDTAASEAYYKDKVVLITGGGGSIGSELCRQLAVFSPRQLIILDVYENGAYDLQQELRMKHPGSTDLRVEIASVTSKTAMERVFRNYRPQIVIHAAAHKHVPLMEHNCIEAVENNVFGTKNVIELCEQYGAERFMMVSTDKAVNPTNVMGATKRMCEMLVQSASLSGKVKYSATRFGNVLGSAGSVIPLFRRQIAAGGPVTITDKRIIRYFMTIPEAAQLVLESGAMAKNGELFVLDMGNPVKILDLAESMIRLSGVRNIEIKEIGLRPGEKLYEELLVKTEELDKTANEKIFVEREKHLDAVQVAEAVKALQIACASGDDETVKQTLKQVVPTYRSPDEVNNKE